MGPALLIVDDNPNNLRSMEALLSDMGAQLTLVDSGKKALLELLKSDYALILLDVQMPELDGYETARLIRQRERSRTVPIIFITAHHRTDAGIQRAYELGAVDFLFKPVVTEILRAKVAVFLDLYRKTQEVARQAELLRTAQEREHQRSLADAKVEFERKRLEQEAQREREHKATLEKKAEELAALVKEKDAANTKLGRHANRLQLLAETADDLLRSENAQASWRVLAERLIGALSGDVFLRFEPRDGEARLEEHHGLEAGVVEAASSLPGDAALLRFAQSLSRREAIDSVAGFPSLERLGLASAAVYPVAREGNLDQILCVGTRAPRSFDEGDLSLLQIMSDQAIVAVDRADLLTALREADKRKDEFIAMLGHELRNPLTPIQNSLEVFRTRAGDDPVLQRSLAAADRQVRLMVRLVDDLLDVSRITRGKVELRRQTVPLANLFEQALHSVEPQMRQRRHTLHKELPPADVQVDVDANRMVQVLANLLGNASKYTPAGGHVELLAEVEGADLRVRVRDNGVGIRPEMLNRIFDIFMQASASPDRTDAGLGLGLTVARSLAEMHGGTLVARSEGEGKGSEFELRLPVVVSAAAEQPARVNGHPAALAVARSLKVLLVEDNADIRETLKDLLELHGHQVHEAADGAEGLAELKTLAPDVALIDIGLPEMDGYAVAREARQVDACSATRLIALTGYGTEEDRRKALAAGFDAHLTKPVTFDDLLELFHRLELEDAHKKEPDATEYDAARPRA